jgi:hypothetical protein
MLHIVFHRLDGTVLLHGTWFRLVFKLVEIMLIKHGKFVMMEIM